MEIDKFIEQDIRHYLERRQSSGDEADIKKTPRKDGILAPDEMGLYTQSRDYASELEAALKERDTPKAKRVLQALKESMSDYPPDSPEHVETKRLFTSLYVKFKQAIGQHEEFEEELLRQEVASLGPPPAVQPTPAGSSPSPAMTQPSSDSTTPAMTLPQPARQRPPGMSDEEEQAFLADIAETESLLQEHAYQAAIRHYQDLKRRISLEEMTPEQRMRVYERLKSIYENIHRLIIGKRRKHGVQESMQESGLLKRFKHHLAVAKEATDAGELTEAMQEYHLLLDLRRGLQGATRHEATRSLTTLHERILSLRQRLKGKRLDEAEQHLHAKP